MKVTEEIEIKGSKESVWKVITDIDQWQNVISSIIKINVINKPESELVGLKWQETREMFGKEATETMWITDVVAGEYYATRAENHGSVYITQLSIKEEDGKSTLSMSFTGTGESFIAKFFSILMAPLIKSSIKKALIKDLEDIRDFIEKH
ncbi:MAG: SRPBCC family protein [Gammaproteobacteria bacterium]|nr:SRPBCC family protein [Gammaproteobacteria bacterium]MDH5628554.1 SRPBCC family protein [Gammaproteobacteria bacterium]